MNTKSLLIISFLPLAAACSEAHSGPPPATPPPVPVRVVAIEKASLPRTLRAVGRLAHKRSLTLAFKNGGTVRQLLVQEGALIHRGQRLAIIDPTEIDAQVAQSRATVEKADRDLQRVEKLRATQAAAQIDADNARTAADQAHASLASALYNQSASVLIAPEDGRIDKRLAEVGEQVAPGRAIYTMSSSASGLVVRVGVIDRDLPGIKLGDTAEVQIDALPGRTSTAQVSEIATAPSVPAGTYEIELRMSAPESILAAGMTAKVTLTRPTGIAPIVPLGALVDADGLNAQLYELVDGKGGPTVRRVPVELAYVVGDRAAVAHGLSGGERIVSEGASFVEPGRIVKPISETPPTALPATKTIEGAHAHLLRGDIPVPPRRAKLDETPPTALPATKTIEGAHAHLLRGDIPVPPRRAKLDETPPTALPATKTVEGAHAHLLKGDIPVPPRRAKLDEPPPTALPATKTIEGADAHR